MINFAVGLGIGFVVAIFVYRNNKAKMGKMVAKIDDLYDQLSKAKTD